MDYIARAASTDPKAVEVGIEASPAQAVRYMAAVALVVAGKPVVHKKEYRQVLAAVDNLGSAPLEAAVADSYSSSSVHIVYAFVTWYLCVNIVRYFERIERLDEGLFLLR